MGVERPPKGAFHKRLLFGSLALRENLYVKLRARETPLCSGPRQSAEFPANALLAQSMERHARTSDPTQSAPDRGKRLICLIFTPPGPFLFLARQSCNDKSLT